ncbi:MAG: tol-pal system protein YbgF [Pseudolabrys sp.]|nr:tol-pal system protein YbgF [Pseudolabrys sp.]
MTEKKSLKVPVLTLAAALIATALLGAPAQAQQQGNFLDDLFSRGEPRGGQQQGAPRGQQAQADYADPGAMTVRLDRLENALRQLTGTIEQLQFRNQQLETQLKRMQDDNEYRFQQLGSRGGAATPPARATQPAAPSTAPAQTPAASGRRGDLFDPSQNPDAPGVPRTLGSTTTIAAPEPGSNEAPVGAPGGRDAGAPLDLSTLAANAAATPMPAAPQAPPRNISTSGTQMATLPPTATPQDEYDLAYGYVLHKDYAQAEQGFRDFVRKYPNERLVPDAQYWLGESLFQRQRYRDAAEAFLAVSTKYENAGKAPDSLLRLGQSLAALKQKEAACATLTEVGRKYPKASASVKRGVTQELKRAGC